MRSLCLAMFWKHSGIGRIRAGRRTAQGRGKGGWRLASKPFDAAARRSGPEKIVRAGFAARIKRATPGKLRAAGQPPAVERHFRRQKGERHGPGRIGAGESERQGGSEIKQTRGDALERPSFKLVLFVAVEFTDDKHEQAEAGQAFARKGQLAARAQDDRLADGSEKQAEQRDHNMSRQRHGLVGDMAVKPDEESKNDRRDNLVRQGEYSVWSASSSVPSLNVKALT